MKFEHNVTAYECFLHTKFGDDRLKNLNRQKFANLNLFSSVTTGIDEKWFVIFENTINHFSFRYVCLPNLNILLFFLFCICFFFLPLTPFKPLNALYSKFERLKISGRTFVRQKLGVSGWGSPSIGSSNVLNF